MGLFCDFVRDNPHGKQVTASDVRAPFDAAKFASGLAAMRGSATTSTAGSLVRFVNLALDDTEDLL